MTEAEQMAADISGIIMAKARRLKWSGQEYFVVATILEMIARDIGNLAPRSAPLAPTLDDV